MSRFLELYVHTPIQALLAQLPERTEELPDLTMKMAAREFSVSLLGEKLTVNRTPRAEEASDEDDLPDDVEEVFPGP